MQNTTKPVFTDSHRLRVLLADTPDVCQQLRQGLRRLPFIEIVTETNTDRQTLEHVFELAPDLVILAARLPEMGGFEVLRMIKRVVPRCTVILTSNHVNKFIRETASFLGAQTVCPIGDGPSDLCSLLKDIWDKRAGDGL